MNAVSILSLFCQHFSPGKTDPGIYQAGPESHLGGEETPCVVLLTVSLLIVTEQDFRRPHQITRHRSQHKQIQTHSFTNPPQRRHSAGSGAGRRLRGGSGRGLKPAGPVRPFVGPVRSFVASTARRHAPPRDSLVQTGLVVDIVSPAPTPTIVDIEGDATT